MKAQLWIVAAIAGGAAVAGCFPFYLPEHGESASEPDDAEDDAAWAGHSCEDGILVDSFPFSWTGDLFDYYESFTPTGDCGDGDGGTDVWLTIEAPPMSTLAVSEVSGAEVTIRWVLTCSTTGCIEWAESPEDLVIDVGGTPPTIHIIVSEAAENEADEIELLVELL